MIEDYYISPAAGRLFVRTNDDIKSFSADMVAEAIVSLKYADTWAKGPMLIWKPDNDRDPTTPVVTQSLIDWWQEAGGTDKTQIVEFLINKYE